MPFDHTLRENGHEVEDINNIPSIDIWEDISSQQDFGASFEELQSEAFEELG